MAPPLRDLVRPGLPRVFAAGRVEEELSRCFNEISSLRGAPRWVRDPGKMRRAPG